MNHNSFSSYLVLFIGHWINAFAEYFLPDVQAWLDNVQSKSICLLLQSFVHVIKAKVEYRMASEKFRNTVRNST